MSWGNSWGNSNGGSQGSWGTSSWCSNSGGCNPEGQHHGQCIAGSSWSNNGMFGSGSSYDENCPGCRRDRACSTWSNRSSGGNPALKLASLFGVGVIAKKSLWD